MRIRPTRVVVVALSLIATASCGGGAKRPAVQKNPDVEQPAAPLTDSDSDSTVSVLSRPLANHIEITYAVGTPERKAAIGVARRMDALVSATEDADQANDRPAQDAYDAAIWCYSARLGPSWSLRSFYDAASLDRTYYGRLMKAEAAMSGRMTKQPPLENRGQYCPQESTGLPPANSSLRRFDDASASRLLADGAASACVQPPLPATAVVFFNGMFTERGEAYAHLQRLETRMRGMGHAGKSFYLAYNRDEPVEEQLLQVGAQKFDDLSMTVTRTLQRLFGWRDEQNRPFEELREPISRMARNNDTDLRTMLADVKLALKDGDSLLFVSHSQGNFYSNYTYELLPLAEKSRVKQVMVATPTSFTADNGKRWTTFANDIYMWTVRVFLETLPAQDFKATWAEDPAGHAFSDAYLTSARSWPHIEQNLKSALAELPKPQAAGTASGKVKVSLRWDEPTTDDFALHVFEGERVHLYYRSRIGGLGVLKDETAGAKWDSYETICDLNSTAELRIGAHFTKGEGTGRATLKVEAGGATKSYSLAFDAPQGPAGVLSPRLAAKVVVRRDGDAGPWTLRIVDL